MGKTNNRMIWLLTTVFPVFLAAPIFIFVSCSELEQKYIRQDKFYRISLMENIRDEIRIPIESLYLNDPDPEIRARMALALGRIGGGVYNQKFIEHLPDSSKIAAEAKFFAAGLIGDSTFFDPIYNLTASGTPALEAAVEALGRVADSINSEKIAEFLDHSDTMVVYQAMLALYRAGQWNFSNRMAEIGLSSDNRKVKYGALYALSLGGRTEAREFFKVMLSDADPEYRMLAYDGLGRSGDTSSASLIATGLNDDDLRVAGAAMGALQRIGNPGVKFIYSKLPDLQDEKLLAFALDILGDFPDVSGQNNLSDVIEKILREDGRENIRASAAKSLLKIKGAEALFAIDKELANPTTHQKKSIAEALVEIPKDAAVARLAKLFNDEVPSVRFTALASLGMVDSSGATHYIETALKDIDWAVQWQAVDMASKRKMVQFIRPIAELFLNNRATLDINLKQGIIECWQEYDNNPEYDSLIIAVLEEGSNDESYFIRIKASEILLDKYEIDRRGGIASYSTLLENKNYRHFYERYENNPKAVISTSKGDITIELLYKEAQMTVNNFIELAEKGYYDSLEFHRVVPNFVIQDGCPRRDGWGGPGYLIRCEYNRLSYKTGMFGMARAGKDTGGSQYFITLSPQPRLDSRYTLFGQVVSGMDIAQQIVRGDRINSVRIIYDRDE
ncbi:MAG: peptidylprolyl isomerase [candidate division Zixibacteria bacterium]